MVLIGDVVGKPGRQLVVRLIPELIKKHELDLVIVNGENSAGGSGITPAICEEFFAAGVDGITLGDHIYKRREILPYLESSEKIVKPANFPAEAPGRDWMCLKARDGTPVVVFSLLGRIFMRPVDCPFRAASRVLQSAGTPPAVTVLDFHAEATSDKQLMGRYLDGRVSAVLGTHTHVPTADDEILPGGTAFQCDVGMTGPYASILGRRVERVLETTLNFKPTHFEVASESLRLCGTIVDIDPDNRLATAIQRLRVDVDEADLNTYRQPAATQQ